MDDSSPPVQQYMHAPVHTIHMDESAAVALERLQEMAISCLAVVDDTSRLAGVVSRSDLIRAGRAAAAHEPVDDISRARAAREHAATLQLRGVAVARVMTRNVITAVPNQSVKSACQTMIQAGVHRVFVVSGDDLLGVFSTRDVMRVVADARLERPIEDFMSRPVFTVSVADTLARATALLEKAHITGVVVTDSGWPVGLFSQSEALDAHDLHPDTSIEDVMNPSVMCMPASTRLLRAARQALSMNVRRIIAARDRDMVGILTGLDFARAVSQDE